MYICTGDLIWSLYHIFCVWLAIFLTMAFYTGEFKFKHRRIQIEVERREVPHVAALELDVNDPDCLE